MSKDITVKSPSLAIPILVAGLILRLTSGWFNGQHTVGDICIWVGGLGILIPITLFVAVIVIAIIANDRRY
jgi:ABC-type multidrug transport system permease subunit